MKLSVLEKEDIEKVALLPLNWGELSDRTVVLSGGTGFIGTFLINVFRYRNNVYNNCIHVVSFTRRGGISDETVEYVKTDVINLVEYIGKADFVIHLASNTHPKQYGEDPVGTITTNVIGCNNLLKFAVNKGAKFVLASSVEIYGQGTELPMDEHYCGYIDCNNARNGYNEAKRVCESLCQSYRSQYGIETVIARFARVFGADKKKDTKALAQFMDKAVVGEDIILKSKGNQRFSYCYIADAVSGLLKVILDGIDGEAYNISDDDEGKTLADYAGYMAGLSGKKVVFEIVEDQAASKATYALLDTTKIKSLGWKPQYTVTEGIDRTYRIKKETEEGH